VSHPDWSENCQGRIIDDAGDSVNVSDLDDWCRYAGQDFRTWYRLALRPTSERLAANWSLGLQHAPALGLISRQRKAFIQFVRCNCWGRAKRYCRRPDCRAVTQAHRLSCWGMALDWSSVSGDGSQLLRSQRGRLELEHCQRLMVSRYRRTSGAPTASSKRAVAVAPGTPWS
jgi:hypothetical protein